LAATLATVGVLAVSAPIHAELPGMVTIDVRNVPLVDVLRLVATQANLNIICDQSVPNSKVTFRMVDVSARTVLDALESTQHLTEIIRDGVIRVVPIGSLVTSLDSAANVQTVTLDVPGSAQAIVQALQTTLPGVVAVAAPSGKAILVSGSPAAVERATEFIAELTVPPVVLRPSPAIIGLRYISATEAQKLLVSTGYVDANTSIVPDDTRSQLVLGGASPDVVQRIRDAVAVIDKPSPQVTYEVDVLDVTDTGNDNYGVQWGGLSSSGQVTQGQAFTAFASKTIPLNATINALVANGKAKVLSRPSVAVTNGETGKILVGEQYPIETTQSGLVTGTTVQFLQIGVQLDIKPSIGSDGSILTDLTTTYSAITGTDPVSQYPIVGTRTVTSVIRVRDGQPIVLAGLFQDVTSDTVQKVPLLGDIPVFGQIFRNRVKSSQRDEIIFAIRPHLGVAPAPDKGEFRASH
jgi:type II secretory pathway component GspD/PulD (secretin)